MASLAIRRGECDARQVVLFYRDFRFPTGGHWKVWNYFRHVAGSTLYRPVVRFSGQSVLDPSNPWSSRPDAIVTSRVRPNVRFLAGLDWTSVARRRRRHPKVPVLNLVQHVRHADPRDPRHEFLGHPAIRMCVSPEVAAALVADGTTRGPLLTIPNAVDTADLPAARPIGDRRYDLVVAGLKRPDTAIECAKVLKGDGYRVKLLTERVERADFLASLADARVALLLPTPTEGFYLPALEAMAIGTVVVCPDCVGNRSFCVDGISALVPDYTTDELIGAARQALGASEGRLDVYRSGGRSFVDRHRPEKEREAFMQVLDRLPDLWEEAIS